MNEQTFEEWCKTKEARKYLGHPSQPMSGCLTMAAEAAWNAAKKESDYCTCEIDWSDGTAYCQECGKKVKA